MAEDARISTALPRHPKTVKLQRRLGAPGCWYLVCFFLWVAENRADGDLEGMTAEDIEIAAGWSGTAGEFTGVLCEVRFLDGREGSWRVHDWAEHNPWAANRGRRVEAAKAAANRRWQREVDQDCTRKECESDAPGIRVVYEPHTNSNADSMLTTQPNPTTPHHTEKTKRAEAPAEWIPVEAWTGFVEMRRKMRAAMTIRAVELIVNQLQRLRAEGFDAGEVLDQSTRNNWKDVYPLKGNTTHGNAERKPIVSRRTEEQYDALDQFKRAEARTNSRMGHSDGDGDGCVTAGTST